MQALFLVQPSSDDRAHDHFNQAAQRRVEREVLREQVGNVHERGVGHEHANNPNDHSNADRRPQSRAEAGPDRRVNPDRDDPYDDSQQIEPY